MTEYVTRPIKRANWKLALKRLPDQQALDEWLDVFENGEDIGFVGETPPPGKCKRVPPLDFASKVKFGAKILKWFSRGHLLGPFHPNDPILRRHGARINPVFTVDKPDLDVRPVINYSKRLDDGGPSLNERIKEGSRATVEYLQMIEIIYTVLV